MGKYREYTEEDVKEAVKTSFSLSEVLRKLDLKIAGGNFDNLRRKIAQLNLNTSHFTGQVWSKGKTVKDWALYVKDSSRKKFLIFERGHECEDCHLTEWKKCPITLELHHKDGNRLNNEKENLQLLCCNCHAATDNWRNKKRKNASVAELADATDLDDKLSASDENRGVEPFKVGEALTGNAEPSIEPRKRKNKGVESGRREPKFCECCNKKEIKSGLKYCSAECYREITRNKIPKVPDLLDCFNEHKSYLAVGKHYGVSDNAVRKWVLGYGIENMVKAHSSAQTK